MAPSRIVLIRHGETIWNVEGRLQGHGDSPLSARGSSQAQALAQRLVGFEAAALYASDLGRALSTAAFLEPVLGRRTLAEPSLRERHLGVFQGLTRAEAMALHPELWRSHRSGAVDFAPPGGESARQCFERTQGALETIARRHPAQCVAVVAHGGTLNAAFRLCTGFALDARRTFALPNASLSILEYSPSGWSLVSWAEVSHLQSLSLGTLDDSVR